MKNLVCSIAHLLVKLLATVLKTMACRKRPRTHANPTHTHTHAHTSRPQTHTTIQAKKKETKLLYRYVWANTIFSAAAAGAAADGGDGSVIFAGRNRRWLEIKKKILGQIHYYANWIRVCTHAHHVNGKHFQLGAIKAWVARDREPKKKNKRMQEWINEEMFAKAGVTFTVCVRMSGNELPCFFWLLLFSS